MEAQVVVLFGEGTSGTLDNNNAYELNGGSQLAGGLGYWRGALDSSNVVHGTFGKRWRQHELWRWRRTAYMDGAAGYLGAGGSGYIGNILLENKYMLGFNVETSENANTLTYTTISENDASEIATTDKVKKGDGSARIEYMAKNRAEYDINQ